MPPAYPSWGHAGCNTHDNTRVGYEIYFETGKAWRKTRGTLSSECSVDVRVLLLDQNEAHRDDEIRVG